jgi:hypothetical protein
MMQEMMEQHLGFILLVFGSSGVMTEELLTEPLKTISKQEILGRTNRLLSFYMTRTAQKTTRPTILPLLHVYS